MLYEGKGALAGYSGLCLSNALWLVPTAKEAWQVVVASVQAAPATYRHHSALTRKKTTLKKNYLADAFNPSQNELIVI
jgi:hypothetical protein